MVAEAASPWSRSVVAEPPRVGDATWAGRLASTANTTTRPIAVRTPGQSQDRIADRRWRDGGAALGKRAPGAGLEGGWEGGTADNGSWAPALGSGAAGSYRSVMSAGHPGGALTKFRLWRNIHRCRRSVEIER